MAASERGSAGFRIERYLDGIGLLAGGANVIMQLSWLPVGHGVAKSTVHSGSVYHHPLKRARTTFTYLAVAMLGTDADRSTMRREVNRAHADVHSGPGDPVRYNAFDPELQLWVAACLYYGMVDVLTTFHGPPSDELADRLYVEGARFGTTLQVPPESWPPDRAAFQEYWAESVRRIEMDDLTRAYLTDFAGLGFLPWPFRTAFGWLNRFLCTGFLPEPFRRELRFAWDDKDQRRFDRLMRALAAVNRLLPSSVRALPFTLLLRDFRRRARAGRPIV